MNGRIFDIQRFSLHDGPGIRTTVFFKGCPLRCRWCHNPESIAPQPQLSFIPAKCIGCGYCFRVCPSGAHSMLGSVHVLDRSLCTGCGLCAKECYPKSLEMVGRTVSVDEVMAEVLADKVFYETSGGGLTLSGGEPTLQIDFANAVLTKAKENGLHTAVETCGFCPAEALERIRGKVDLFLYDCKETDPARHKDHTGVECDRIVDNLRRLHASGATIRLRCPIVPGMNDRDDHWQGLAALCRNLPNLEGIEIMPYHRLGEGKDDRFGLEGEWRVRGDAPPAEAVAAWKARLRELGAAVIEG